MKMIKFLILGLGLSLLFFSCIEEEDTEGQQQEELDKLKTYLANMKIDESSKINGIYFLRCDTITGAKPLITDYVLINYNMRLLNSKLLETNNKKLAASLKMIPSVNTTGPFYSKVGDLFLAGIRTGLTMLNEGDSAVFIMPSDMAFGSYYTSEIPSFSSIIYEVRLVKIIKDPIVYDRELLNKRVTDSLLVNLSDTDETGNYVKIIALGDTTKRIDIGNNVLLRYKGSFVDGRYFGDRNVFDTILMQPGYDKFIAGFEAAVLAMNNKSKAKIVIPYYNAYGPKGRTESNGAVAIPYYTSLCYDIEIISIK